MIDRGLLLEVLRIGATAISPYNTQPWRFRLLEGSIEVYILRTKNFFLKLQGVSHMTLGCLLENLEAGARHVGLRPRTRFYDRPLGPDAPCAVVELEPDPSLAELDVAHLFERATNRKPYRTDPLPEQVQRMVLEIAGEGAKVYLSQGEEKRLLATILTELESVRLSNYKMTREAVEYLRFDHAELAARPEGLDVRTLELPDGIVRVLRPIQRRRIHRLLRLVGVVGMATRRQRELLLASAAIVTYAIEDRRPEDFVRIGRIIQRTLNELARAGVASASVLSGLYLLDVLGSNPEIFSRREIRVMARGQAALERFFATSARNIVFIIRIGMSDSPTARQGRRPVGELLLEG